MKPSNKTIVDYKPEEAFLLPEHYEAIKDKQPGIPFSIEDKNLAVNLIHLDMIKREEARVSRENHDGNPKEYLLNNLKYTGDYLLSPKVYTKLHTKSRGGIKKCPKDTMDTILDSSLFVSYINCNFDYFFVYIVLYRSKLSKWLLYFKN